MHTSMQEWYRHMHVHTQANAQTPVPNRIHPSSLSQTLHYPLKIVNHKHTKSVTINQIVLTICDRILGKLEALMICRGYPKDCGHVAFAQSPRSNPPPSLLPSFLFARVAISWPTGCFSSPISLQKAVLFGYLKTSLFSAFVVGWHTCPSRRQNGRRKPTHNHYHFAHKG